jgi:hypothetical protein
MPKRTGFPTRLSLVALLTASLLALGACDRHADTPTTPTGPTQVTVPATRAVSISGTVADLAGNPVAGATVTGTVGGSRSVAVSDADGRFSLGTFVASDAQTMTVVIDASGHVGYTLQRPVSSVGSEWTVNVRLPERLTLPIDGSVDSSLLATDPAAYVGDPYESDYSWNTKYFAYTTPADADVVVELEWEGARNAALVLWAQGGELRSQLSGTRQVLRLPHGSEGLLLVGQPSAAGALLQSVTFRLTTRTVPPGRP